MKSLYFIFLISFNSAYISAAEKHEIKPGKSLFVPAEKPIEAIKLSHNSDFSRVILDGFQNEKITVMYKNLTATVLNGVPHIAQKGVKSISLVLPKEISESSSSMVPIEDPAYKSKIAVVIFSRADDVDEDLESAQKAALAILAKYKN